MTVQIFKIQKSLASSGGKTRMLVYNKDRSVQYEDDWDPQLDFLMRGQHKIYVEGAHREKENTHELEIMQLVPTQEW